MGMRGDSVHLETFWGGILSGVTFSGGILSGGDYVRTPIGRYLFVEWTEIIWLKVVYLLIWWWQAIMGQEVCTRMRRRKLEMKSPNLDYIYKRKNWTSLYTNGSLDFHHKVMLFMCSYLRFENKTVALWQVGLSWTSLPKRIDALKMSTV